MIAPDKLVVGQLYYMLQFEDEALTRLMIASYEYKGKIEKESEEQEHLFEVLGDNAELVLKERNLAAIVDLSGLIEELQEFQRVGNGSLDGDF
jgi:hypothetical protein